MGTRENTSDKDDRRPTFGAASAPLYVLAPDATAADCQDQLLARLGQLNSMLQETYGDWREKFESKSDEKRDDYMWACANLAEECEDLAKQLPFAGAAPLQRDATPRPTIESRHLSIIRQAVMNGMHAYCSLQFTEGGKSFQDDKTRSFLDALNLIDSIKPCGNTENRGTPNA